MHILGHWVFNFGGVEADANKYINNNNNNNYYYYYYYYCYYYYFIIISNNNFIYPAERIS